MNDHENLALDTSDATVVDTNSGLEDGQTKCEKCGSTEISLHVETGHLRCHWCRHEQAPTKAEKLVTDISQLHGQVIGSGAQEMIADTDDQLTFQCPGCAAEVVIDTSQAQQARCHWCRQTLSVNNQIPNGAVPDKVLPFSVKRDDAIQAIVKFVGNRKFFAHKKFKAAFTADNVMGVYLPYMVIDVNAHASFEGEAKHTVRTYTETNGDIERTFKDVDVYRINRDFDLTIEDLTVESSAEKLDKRSKTRTNNIINAIKPFDTENSVTWNANYMTGFTSQKRDVDVSKLTGLVQDKSRTIATDAVGETATQKSRGVKWQRQNMTFKGKQWRSAYMPIWLYSYQLESSKDESTIHYVAVNGRTQKTMGSVPLDMTKLIIFSLLTLPLFGAGIILFFVMLGRYRNANAVHDYKRETTRHMRNLVSNDTLVRQDRRVLVSERNINQDHHDNHDTRRSVVVATGANRNRSNQPNVKAQRAKPVPSKKAGIAKPVASKTITSAKATVSKSTSPSKTTTSPKATVSKSTSPSKTTTSPKTTASRSTSPSKTTTSPKTTASRSTSPSKTTTSPKTTVSKSTSPSKTTTSPKTTASRSTSPNRTTTSPKATASRSTSPSKTTTSPKTTASRSMTPSRSDSRGSTSASRSTSTRSRSTSRGGCTR